MMDKPCNNDISYLLRIMRIELEIPSIVIASRFNIPVNDLIEYESGTQIPNKHLTTKLLDYYTYQILYKKKGDSNNE